MKNQYKWYSLDTAANMFASIQKREKNRTRICRVSIELKNKVVDKEILKRAVKEAVKRFPYFSVRYKAGFFWAYLEETDEPPFIGEETEVPTAVQWLGRSGSPEFRVLYYKKRISLEFAHMISDGTGGTEFLKAIVARYLNLLNSTDYSDETVIAVNSKPNYEECENAYGRYFQKNEKVEEVVNDTYILKGELNKDYTKAVYGLMPVDALKLKTKSRGVSVTEYLSAAAILAAIKAEKEPINEFIRISIPINLRNFFETKTLRNFACDTTLSFNPEGRRDVTLEEILNVLKGELKKNVTKENLQKFINKTHSKTINPVLRAVPYFIKKPVLNSSQFKNHREGMTLIISNIGNITFPDWLENEIERVYNENGNGSVYGLSILSACSSYKGILTISFTQCNRDTSFVREFFRIISSDGVPVRVESSDENGFNNNEKDEKGKRCSACDVDLAEEYTICPICGAKAVNEAKRVEGIRTYEFPLEFSPVKATTKKAPKTGLSKEKLKAYFHI